MSDAATAQPPTSPKKQSLMPSTPLRRRLRAHGHALNPLLRIGKDGITFGLVQQLTQLLFDHELCKVKLEAECPLDRFAAAARLSGEPGVQIAQILGRTILVYKRHPQKPRFEGPRAQAAAEIKRNASPDDAPARGEKRGRRPSRRR